MIAAQFWLDVVSYSFMLSAFALASTTHIRVFVLRVVAGRRNPNDKSAMLHVVKWTACSTQLVSNCALWLGVVKLALQGQALHSFRFCREACSRALVPFLGRSDGTAFQNRHLWIAVLSGFFSEWFPQLLISSDNISVEPTEPKPKAKHIGSPHRRISGGKPHCSLLRHKVD